MRCAGYIHCLRGWLTGFAEAIRAVFPQTKRYYAMHRVHHSLRFGSWKECKVSRLISSSSHTFCFDTPDLCFSDQFNSSTAIRGIDHSSSSSPDRLGLFSQNQQSCGFCQSLLLPPGISPQRFDTLPIHFADIL